MGGWPEAAQLFATDSKAGKIRIVPISYIKMAQCKYPGIIFNLLGKYE